MRLTQHARLLRIPPPPAGQDSSGRDSTEYRALQAQIRATEKRVVVHSLAFTSSHDFDFLNAIRRDLGTVEGGFQYAEPGDGAEALRNKLQAIFETVSVKLPIAEFVITAQGYEFVSDVRRNDTTHARHSTTRHAVNNADGGDVAARAG
jgi:hypothetical protein